MQGKSIFYLKKLASPGGPHLYRAHCYVEISVIGITSSDAERKLLTILKTLKGTTHQVSLDDGKSYDSVSKALDNAAS